MPEYSSIQAGALASARARSRRSPAPPQQPAVSHPHKDTTNNSAVLTQQLHLNDGIKPSVLKPQQFQRQSSHVQARSVQFLNENPRSAQASHNSLEQKDQSDQYDGQLPIISEAHYTISQDDVANDSMPKGHATHPMISTEILTDFDFDSFLHEDEAPVPRAQYEFSSRQDGGDAVVEGSSRPPQDPRALHDYQMQLMLLEHQNSKHLMTNRLVRSQRVSTASLPQDHRFHPLSAQPLNDDEDLQQLERRIQSIRTASKAKVIPGRGGADNALAMSLPLSKLASSQVAARRMSPLSVKDISRGVSEPQKMSDETAETAEDIGVLTAESNRSMLYDSVPINFPPSDHDHIVHTPQAVSANELVEPQCGPRCFNSQALLHKLAARVKELELELSNLRTRPLNLTQDELPPEVQIFHCLADDKQGAYLLPPSWAMNGEEAELKGSFFIPDPKGYAAKLGHVHYVIYMHYNVEHMRKDLKRLIKAKKPLPQPPPVSYEICLFSDTMKSAFAAFFNTHPDFREDFPGVNESAPLVSPFPWWFHSRKLYDAGRISEHEAHLVAMVTDWIDKLYGNLYNRVSDQFRRGKVSQWSMEYLIKRGNVLVSHEKGALTGHLAMSTLSLRTAIETDSETHINEPLESHWVVSTRSISYCGSFFENTEDVPIVLRTSDTREEVDIMSLGVVPLKYHDQALQDRLYRRGCTYWKCRERQFVAYEGLAIEGQRFMIDFQTYNELHPHNSWKESFELRSKMEIPLDQDGNPVEPDVFLFPSRIPGFDFRRKKWSDIEVDRIDDVTWDETAFGHLVADPDVKDLIEALIRKQLAVETSTDLIKNKGNGLIMLLHGSPGTGKTFTAESVAELARKPLYPVTCGDIGTDPEKVEKYLEQIFYLGKKWNCVLLLDEAEVFLEQRTLQDLHRNALVSVFLRALEYYDGILILTTNRVGTFDEAFKSRIQISLPYKRLNVDQRKQIWRNFFNRLQQLEQQESVDFDDIDAHLNDLAAYSMNGRQIRNSITTARQLAEFKNRKMNFASLKKTIMVAEKFERYLADVREGDVTDLQSEGKEGKNSDEIDARLNTLR